MLLLKVSDVLALERLEPQQALLAQGRLVESTKVAPDATVMFCSHMWTSFDGPDHTGEQLRVLQALLTAIAEARTQLGHGNSSWAAALLGRGGRKDKLPVRAWRKKIRDAYVWIE
jgi:hypothetical protein